MIYILGNYCNPTLKPKTWIFIEHRRLVCHLFLLRENQCSAALPHFHTLTKRILKQSMKVQIKNLKTKGDVAQPRTIVVYNQVLRLSKLHAKQCHKRMEHCQAAGWMQCITKNAENKFIWWKYRERNLLCGLNTAKGVAAIWNKCRCIILPNNQQHVKS